MRKKQVSSQAELPLEQRIRVADFLLLLITIDRRLTSEKKASKAAKADNTAIKKAVDNVIFICKIVCLNLLYLLENEPMNKP